MKTFRHTPRHNPPKTIPRAVQVLCDRLGTIAGVAGAELIGVQQAILAHALLNADPVLYEDEHGRVDPERLAGDVRALSDRLRNG